MAVSSPLGATRESAAVAAIQDQHLALGTASVHAVGDERGWYGGGIEANRAGYLASPGTGAPGRPTRHDPRHTAAGGRWGLYWRKKPRWRGECCVPARRSARALHRSRPIAGSRQHSSQCMHIGLGGFEPCQGRVFVMAVTDHQGNLRVITRLFGQAPIWRNARLFGYYT